MLLQLMVIVLTLTLVSNVALGVLLLVTWRNFLRGLHGPQLRFGNKYVKRDALQGGPLSATGIVPTGTNVPVLQQDSQPSWRDRLISVLRRRKENGSGEPSVTADNVIRLMPKTAATQGDTEL